VPRPIRHRTYGNQQLGRWLKPRWRKILAGISTSTSGAASLSGRCAVPSARPLVRYARPLHRFLQSPPTFSPPLKTSPPSRPIRNDLVAVHIKPRPRPTRQSPVCPAAPVPLHGISPAVAPRPTTQLRTAQRATGLKAGWWTPFRPVPTLVAVSFHQRIMDPRAGEHPGGFYRWPPMKCCPAR
jgi:hypothetical protein